MDEGGIETLRNVFYQCVSDGRFKLVVSLSDVGFISYMAVGVMVERLRKLRSLKGDMKLVGINLYAERLFRMVGIRGLFECYDSEAQAIGTFQEAA